MAKKKTLPNAAARSRSRDALRDVLQAFWERPDVMNLLSDLLLLFAAAVAAWAAYTALASLPVLPVQSIVIAGPLQQVDTEQAETTVRETLAGNLITANLTKVRLALEKLPWVRHATIIRRWPDTLEVHFEEQTPIASWNLASGDTLRLVNLYGEVFQVSATTYSPQGLPLFIGPPDTAAAMTERYAEFAAALLTIGRRITALTCSPRLAWEVRLDDGVRVVLGRDDSGSDNPAILPVDARLQRFVDYYPAARQTLLAAAKVVDMRYPNGFTLAGPAVAALDTSSGRHMSRPRS